MRRLNKLSLPQDINDLIQEFIDQANDELTVNGNISDSTKSKYRNERIKALLLKETHGKCVYCESKLEHVAYGDIEHITPKSTNNPNDIFGYDNLTIACDVCNTNKSTKGVTSPLLSPYTTRPESRLDFQGPLVLWNRGDLAAEKTVKIVDLNRLPLLERRVRSLLQFNDLYNNYLVQSDTELKDYIKQQVVGETEKVSEFSLMKLVFLKVKGFVF